jgi:predicted TIM-barrel fold metal-dependent hydrolase
MSDQFIDCHHHLWDLDEGTYLWLEEEDPEETEVVGDYSAIRRSYRINDLLADFDGSNVTKSVHVQAEYGGPDQVWETAWLQGIADKHGFPHGIIAKTDLSSDSARAELERHGEHANMRGVRNFAQGEDLLTPEFGRGLQALLDLGMVYDLNSTWEGMDGARRAAAAFPELQFILGHAGMPLDRSKEYFDHWQAAMRNLAEAPNVAVKISGLGMADHNWSVESIRPWVLATVEAFGVERCMFASNWPVDRLYSDYSTVVEAYREITIEWSETDTDAIFWKNAERFYRI